MLCDVLGQESGDAAVSGRGGHAPEAEAMRVDLGEVVLLGHHAHVDFRLVEFGVGVGFGVDAAEGFDS